MKILIGRYVNRRKTHKINYVFSASENSINIKQTINE